VGNIGAPLDTVSCFVIKPTQENQDPQQVEFLPRGESGELAVGGFQLAREYLNRPEQTAAAFVSSPYGRLYRTGDGARVLPDGTLECLGRLGAGQVKLRGQRIELGEIEQAILRTKDCVGAFATVESSVLVAFCAVEPGVSEQAILDTCSRWLPQFMLPGELVLLKTFPKLPSGKVDRRKLLDSFRERKTGESKHEDNSSQLGELQQSIISIVSSVLDSPVDIHTRLGSSGLDSLSAIRLASSLRSAGYATSASKLMSSRTVSGLLSSLEQRSEVNLPIQRFEDVSLLSYWDAIATEVPEILALRDEVEDIIRCSPLQKAMLAESGRHPTMYWNMVELDVDGDAAPQQVANALRIVARNNEILRSGFVPQRDGFMSLVFKGLESSQIRVVREFDYDLCERRYLHILHPLDVQIRAATPEQPLKILIHIHHAIYDGWSFDMLVSDLSDAMSGRAVVSRPQFRDFSAFSLHTPAREQADIAKAFWTDHLLGWNKVPFPLLTDVKEPHKQPLCTVDFLSLQRDEVSTASERLGCSTQVIFQASLAIVWSGILGASDIVLGTVTSGRTAPVDGVETLMGPCIAALPLRIDFGRVTENVHLINQIQASNREMMEHSTLPTSDIRHAASIQPGESLYDVLFVYQESPESRRNTGCPIRQSRHMDHLETKVLVEVEPLDNGFGVQVTYHPDAVRSDMVQDILEQFKAAVVHVLKYPNDHVQSIRHAPVSGISVYNETPTTFSGVPDLATSFEATARGQPSSDAICFSSGNWQDKTSLKTITYNELNILGNRVAHYLQSEGIASNQVVGVVMEKSIDLYAAILGVVKAGCAYLPLLPSTPASRVQEILQQAEVMYCLIDSSALPAIESIRDVCFLDFHSAPFHAMPDSNPRIPADGSRLAYVIYTSGTTGKPKGVAVSQKNIVANIDHLRSMYPQSSVGQSRLLQACSQAFDVSVFEIFFSWHTGMCLCAGSNDTLFDNFERAIRELHITHLSLTPTVASLVNPKNVPEVMFLVTAGEPMTKSVLERWGELLWQGYGPSETTNICSVKPMQREMPIEHLGWVFPNTSVFVLFPKSCDVVPRGWVGEFCYGGDQVAVGYLNSPRITAESFINHPRFGRLYRSGDMGRMLPDGSLVILGRIDTQLKLRGQRIEAGEVNSTITTSGIATTAITMLATRKGQDNDQLVSFYVPSSKGSLNTLLDVDAKENRTLFSTLQARLPSYMVPTHLIPISNVPQTKSGKVDLRRLKSWYSEASQSYIESTALSFKEAYDYGDWTEVERLVADAMAEELQVASNMIDQWTPFVTLGVDSVSAISLARGLSKRLKRKIPVSAIIRNPNVVQLSRYVCSDFATNKTVDSATMVPAEVVERTTLDFIAESMAVEAVLPCTPLQEAMLSGGQNSYINRIMLRLQISADEMRGYWAEMSRRHEILRTCFAATTDTKRAIVQVVLSNWQIPWTTFEVTTPSFDDVVHDHMSRLPNPVDSKSPPVSLAAINYKGSVFLSFICHHALYDGVAMENLWKEVEALANGRSLPPAISYEPFLREVINLPSDYEDFWREQFRDFRTTSLFPKSIGRKLDQATSASSLAIPLAELHHRAQSLGISLLSLCQAAWVNTLSIVYGTSDVCFGNVVSGRTVDVDGIDRLVAPCFNTVPIRKDVASNRHGIETVKYFHQLNSRLLPYQFTPLRYVQKIANARRGLFETLLLLQKPLQEMDDSVWILEEDAGDMDVPLVCEVVPCPSLNTLIINMQYDMNAVSSDIAATLSGIFRHFMEKILETPYATIADKESIPETLREGLEGLKPRQEKPERTGSPDSHSEQWSLVEEQVRQILTQLSGRADSTITRHTTIFQLGLDSINAVQVASLLRRRGINATVSDVMECPTCAKLADRVQRNPSNFGVKQRPAYDFDAFSRLVESQVRDKLPPDSTPEAILPCTPMQAGMLTAFKQSDGRSYLNSMEYVVDVAVSTDNLTRAIEILRDQHPMLRTCFIPINHNDSAFAMVRYPAGSSILPKISVNYENASGTAQEEILHNLRRCLLENPHIPPWQVVLNYDEALTMTLVIHHALYDAQTLQNILNQLNEIIYGNAQISIPPVEGGLAAIIHEAHGNENKDLAKTFWEDQAKSVVVNSFPTMTPLRVTGDSLLTWSMLSNSGLALIQEAIQKTGVSIQAVVQAAWARVLSSYLGESKIVFGVSLSGRDSDETRDSPFPCLTTVPVIAENKSSNLELLRLMMNLNAQVRKHQYAPLNQIQKWLGHPG
jgi:amino acid adenylation domain-containing protein